jgi:tRNA (mo5U34)-methyltransferase
MHPTQCPSWQPKPPDSTPPGFDAQTFFAGKIWHQQWQLFQNVLTPGRNPVSEVCDKVGLPQDLRGKRVLDIGAWNGCFSFECERRGAAEVVALIVEDPTLTGFLPLKALLRSRVRYLQQSVYGLDANLLGQFDVVLFLGVLYHLRYPLLAIDKIRTVCRGTAYVETHVIDNYFLLRGALAQAAPTQEAIHAELPRVPIWRYYKDAELHQDASNQFGPNCLAVQEAFESAGFTVQVQHQWMDRAAFTATATSDLAKGLEKTYEGMYASIRRIVGLPGDQAPSLVTRFRNGRFLKAIGDGLARVFGNEPPTRP